jgi:hypothetical protein
MPWGCGTYLLTGNTITGTVFSETNGDWGLGFLGESGEAIGLNRVGLTAVPEPSTCAAWAGLGAIGLVLYHRQRRQVS